MTRVGSLAYRHYRHAERAPVAAPPPDALRGFEHLLPPSVMKSLAAQAAKAPRPSSASGKAPR